MGEQVRPGNTMFHRRMVTITEDEYERLLSIERAYDLWVLQEHTRLHEAQDDGA